MALRQVDPTRCMICTAEFTNMDVVLDMDALGHACFAVALLLFWFSLSAILTMATANAHNDGASAQLPFRVFVSAVLSAYASVALYILCVSPTCPMSHRRRYARGQHLLRLV